MDGSLGQGYRGSVDPTQEKLMNRIMNEHIENQKVQEQRAIFEKRALCKCDHKRRCC